MEQPNRTVVFVFFLFIVAQLAAQRGDVRVMFYNLENLFDTIDYPATFDEEFLPNGDKHWDSYRYWNKIKKTYQVIAGVGEERLPEIIGFCEVEGFLPLYDLAMNTPLSKFVYTIVHEDSPDFRGIDVALMYQSSRLKLISKDYIEVRFPSDTSKRTRDILYAGFLAKNDTLHCFVNHWPSRRGGQQASEPLRVLVANIVKAKVDSILQLSPQAKILVMGDFNDQPGDKSMAVLESAGMENLSKPLQEACNCGTYRYKSQWNMLDQVLVSPGLLADEGLTTQQGLLKIYKPDFLLQDEDTYGGKKPFRTYLGPRYLGGFSDHLPVYVDIFVDK